MESLRARRVERSILETEKEINKSIENFNKDDIALLFRKLNTTSITFSIIKTEIKKYISEKYGVNVQSYQIISNIKFFEIDAFLVIEMKYFMNFNSLNKYLMQTLRSIDSAYENTFDTAIACIYLAWCGVPYSMAPYIKKKDVSQNDNIIFLSNGFAIETGDHIIDFLRHYRDSDYYEIATYGGRVIKRFYKDSNYLLRTDRKEQITLNSISVRIRTLENLGDSKVSFSYNKVYKSGIFNRIYLYELKNGELPNIISKKKPKIEDVELWKKMLCYNTLRMSSLYTMIREYFTWKKCFYNNEDR